MWRSGAEETALAEGCVQCFGVRHSSQLLQMQKALAAREQGGSE